MFASRFSWLMVVKEERRSTGRARVLHDEMRLIGFAAGATRAHLSVWPLRLHRCIITTSPSSFISRGTRDDISPSPLSLPASTSLTPLSLGLSTSACLAPPGGDSQITAPPWRPLPPRVKSGGGGSERIVLPPEQSQTPSFLPREEAEKAEPTFLPGVAVTCR